MKHKEVVSRRAALASLGAGASLVTGLSLQSSVAAVEPAKSAAPAKSPRSATEVKDSAIAYSKFKMYKVSNSDLDTAPTFEFPFIAGSKFKAVNCGISEPSTQINFEDFLPGPDIVWSMFHDEIQYVTSGRAEIEFHLPPLMAETGKVIAEPGCIYLLPRGARIVWRVLGNEPFRHLCICVPNPGYPIPIAASAVAAK